jgi:hypothetical protein
VINGSSGAVISEDKLFRYLLWRYPDPIFPKDPLGFIMLNPSTADASKNDPTIRKCLGFADRNGFNGIEVGNLSPYRSTEPSKLGKALEGGIDVLQLERNEEHLRGLVGRCRLVVLAWGANVFPWTPEVTAMARRVAGDKARCLGLTAQGAPRHPLMLPYIQPLERFVDP